MRPHEFDAFAAMLSAVAEYCGRSLSDQVIEIYWNGLADLDLDAVRKALNAHVQNPDTGQFMPKIADIRRMLGGTTRDAALVAWNKAMEAVSRAGTYRSVCFDDPIINRVLHDMGGWVKFGQVTEKELPFFERNFVDRYRAYKTTGLDAHPAYLPGISETQNTARGFASDPPVLIGNVDAANRVLSHGSTAGMVAVTHIGMVVAQSVARLEVAHA